MRALWTIIIAGIVGMATSACGTSALDQVRSDMSAAEFTATHDAVMKAEGWDRGRATSSGPGVTPPTTDQCYVPGKAKQPSADERCYSFVGGKLFMRKASYAKDTAAALAFYEEIAATFKGAEHVIWERGPEEKACMVSSGDGKLVPLEKGAKVFSSLGEAGAVAARGAGALCAQARIMEGERQTQALILQPGAGPNQYTVIYLDWTSDAAVIAAMAASQKSSFALLTAKIDKLSAQVDALAHAADAEIPEQMSRETVQQTIRKNLGDVRACYQLALMRDKSIAGKIKLKFRINVDGGVAQAKVVSEDISEAKMLACMEQKLGTWTFPARTKGKILAVSYPIVLRTSR